jgi:hypothetical protein
MAPSQSASSFDFLHESISSRKPCVTKVIGRDRRRMVGLGRLELPTSRLSSARSNQLSYKPEPLHVSKRRMRAREGTSPPRPAKSDCDIQFAKALRKRHGLVREERETKAAKSRKWPLDVKTSNKSDVFKSRPDDLRDPIVQGKDCRDAEGSSLERR